MSLEQTVCAVIERETGWPVNETTSLDTVAKDSLEYANLLVEVGKELDKEVPPERWGSVHTVADLIRELV